MTQEKQEIQLNKNGNKRGMHPNSVRNLHPNVNGRPRKDCSLTSLLKAEIDKVPQGEKQGRTWRQLLVLAWLTGAMKNPVLFKELLDRLEGKVTQPIGGDEANPVYIINVLSEQGKNGIERVMHGERT